MWIGREDSGWSFAIWLQYALHNTKHLFEKQLEMELCAYMCLLVLSYEMAGFGLFVIHLTKEELEHV